MGVLENGSESHTASIFQWCVHRITRIHSSSVCDLFPKSGRGLDDLVQRCTALCSDAALLQQKHNRMVGPVSVGTLSGICKYIHLRMVNSVCATLGGTGIHHIVLLEIYG